MYKISYTNILSLCLCLLFGTQTYSQETRLDTIEDLLLLDRTVISEVIIKSKMNTASSISTLVDPTTAQSTSVSQLISAVPGLIADASTGEVFSRIFSRGISLSAEDDIGWYYSSLQEDGMPVSAVQYNYFSPDLFVRPQLAYQRLEIIKGGKSGILSQNSPGSIINFISQKPLSDNIAQVRLTSGIHQNNQSYFKIDGNVSQRIGQSSWYYDLAYWLRYDKGNRDADFPLGKGIQLNTGITKVFKNGIVSLKLKSLNDHTNRYVGVAATNWEDPEPSFGQSFQTTSLFPQSFSAEIPDGRENGRSNYSFNPSNGIHAREDNALLTIDFTWDDWRLINKAKFSKKSANWQTVIGGQVLGLDNFLSYFISGDQFPVGLVSFTEVESQKALASVNNAGILNAFQGLPTSYEYIAGSLPNDAIMGTGLWYKDDHIDEFMNDIRISKKVKESEIVFGGFYAKSCLDVFTNASFLYSTYESNPRLLDVQLANPDEPTRSLSDQNGVSNYGALLFEQADISTEQFALYGIGDFKLSNNLSADIGFRWENIHHDGDKTNSSPLMQDGGVDGNPLTGYDNGLLVANGEDLIDYSYQYMNLSGALMYQLNNNKNVYGRYSRSHKAPELNYYINNFANVPINEKGTVQTITQMEIGFKHNGSKSQYNATGFYSLLNDVAYSSFEFDSQNNNIFYTPTIYNSSKAFGLELEYKYLLSNTWQLALNSTFQNATLNEFEVYDASGTSDTSDDEVISFDDNKTPHQPNVSTSLAVTHQINKLSSTVRGQHLSKRAGNFENSFYLPAYTTFFLDIDYLLSDSWRLGVSCSNILNAGGLNNFFGPNEFGSSSNAASSEYINSNPTGSFIVFPIAGRSIYLTATYQLK